MKPCRSVAMTYPSAKDKKIVLTQLNLSLLLTKSIVGFNEQVSDVSN